MRFQHVWKEISRTEHYCRSILTSHGLDQYLVHWQSHNSYRIIHPSGTWWPLIVTVNSPLNLKVWRNVIFCSVWTIATRSSLSFLFSPLSICIWWQLIRINRNSIDGRNPLVKCYPCNRLRRERTSKGCRTYFDTTTAPIDVANWTNGVTEREEKSD